MGNNQSIQLNEVFNFIKDNPKYVVNEFIDFIDDDEFFRGSLKRRKVKRRTKDEWWLTDWGKIILNPLIRDVNYGSLAIMEALPTEIIETG